MTRLIRKLKVRAAPRLPGQHHRGLVLAGGLAIPCQLGRSNIVASKREGDGATPRGRYHLVAGLFRPDRLPRPATRLSLRALRHDDGWCDDASDRRYNRALRLPSRAGHEELWRGDGVYDIILITDHNQRPRQRGLGSAIFLHISHEHDGPTAGCIALERQTLRRLLPRLAQGCRLEIER
ncbi:MAG: L,D-transpeptidase family protein [Hyphomicrobiales bacterium]|nr:L,D-transpeptidase family protein [Hyphomicrobiales bacterium]